MNTNRPSTDFYARWRSQVATLITPVDVPANNTEYRRIQMMTAMVFLFALASSVMILLALLAGTTPESIAIVSVLMFWALYAGVRLVSYRVGMLAVLLQAFLPYLLYSAESSAFSLLLLFGTILTNILLSTLFTRVAFTLVILVLNAVLALAFLITTDYLPLFDIINFISLISLIGLFLLLYTWVANRDLQQIRADRDALQDSEERFRIVSELMNDYAYRLRVSGTPENPSTHFEWMTGNTKKITGYTRNRLMQLPDWTSLVHPADLSVYRDRQERLLNGQRPAPLDFRLVRPDDSIRWLRDSARPILDDSGNTRYIYGAVHDITEEINAREALEMHVVQQAIVAELGLLAMSERGISLFDHTVVLIQQVLEVDTCLIFVYNAEQENLQIESSVDTTTDGQTDMIVPATPQQSQAGYTLHTGEPVIVEDYATEDRFTPAVDVVEMGYVSSISLVIQGQEQPYGVLSIHTKTARHFSEDDVYFLQSIVNILGTCIENNRARRAEREQRELAEALRDATVVINSEFDLSVVLEKIQEFLARLIPAHEMSSIILLTGDGEHYRVASVRGMDTSESTYLQQEVHRLDGLSLLNQVIQTGEALIMGSFEDHPDRWVNLDGLEWVQSFLSVPIRVQGRCIGALTLNSSRKYAFTEEDARLLRTFADKTGNAILNARRARELEAMVEERTLELLREREQMQAILDGTGEGIFYAEDTRIRYANSALTTITGYQSHEFIGQSSSMLLPPQDAAAKEKDDEGISTLDHIPEVVEDGGTWRDDVLLQRADGSTFEAGLTISRVGRRDDDVLRTVTIVRDISREKALERQKTRFIANAAHELRSPVTSLNTRLYLIRKQPEQYERHLTHLEKVSLRMNRLISDLLDMSSFEQGRIQLRKETIILQDVLQDTLEMHEAEAEQEQIAIEVDMPLDPVHLLADPHRLQQVFTNLLTNAIHYTPPGGQIHLQVQPETDTVCVLFKDTGEGIPESDLPHIFQPFYRVTKEKEGTGLGLSIAREIVEQHDGSIRAESTPGEGSVFQVVLPLFSTDNTTGTSA
jgi:PAS domain S-box-containing protein